MRRNIKGLLLLLTLLISSCSPAAITPSPGDIQTAIAQTAAAQPTPSDTAVPPTATLDASPTPSSSPTPSRLSPVKATVNAASLNLRTGPSTLFAVTQTFEDGDTVSAEQRTEDNQWVKIEVLDEDGSLVTGWMATLYLSFARDIGILPIAEFPQDQVLRGRVKDTDGNPIPGIGVAVIYRQNNLELRTDVQSDDAGKFITFIPQLSLFLPGFMRA